MITTINEFRKIQEGGFKRHWEEIIAAIHAGLPLKYKSGENVGEAIPVEYKNNVVSFDNGIHVIDEYVYTNANPINESVESTDPLFLAFKAKGIISHVSPADEVIVSINWLHGETDYWFDPHNDKYNMTEVSHSTFGESEPDVAIGKSYTIEEDVEFIQQQQAAAQAEYDAIPKIDSRPTEPEPTGPKIVGKMDLPNDGKSRFKKK